MKRRNPIELTEGTPSLQEQDLKIERLRIRLADAEVRRTETMAEATRLRRALRRELNEASQRTE